MCGFIAAIGPGSRALDQETFQLMTRTLTHRGPDQEGFFRDDNVSMGFRRLAILDLSPTGHQPMTDEDESLVLVFNGEIFNYVELRDELRQRGHRFRSSGDAEVLLIAYKEWGERCTERLNGMFAFVIYDKRAGRVFGARDRFGTKPLYFAVLDDCVLIGSEIKAIRSSGLCGGRFNHEVVCRYLLDSQLDLTHETFFDGIEKVRPSHQFSIDLAQPVPVFKRYWNLIEEIGDAPEDPESAFRELFENAVRMRMRSDVPIGVSLSGGLDSTAIICSMARQWGGDGASTSGELLAFSFESSEFDESRYISATLQQTGARQICVTTAAKTFWDSLDQVLWYHDEPLNSMTPLVGYRIAKLAADNDVKVLLMGQGADEVLGGYSAYFEGKRETLVQQRKFIQLWRETSEYTSQYGGSVPKIIAREIVNNLKGFVQGLPSYAALAIGRRRREIAENPWLSEDFKSQLPEPVYWRHYPGLAGRLLYSVEDTPLPLYLRQDDRNSMAHSVESRLPFLDHRLVALAFSLSEDWKVHGCLGKVLLRKSMRGQIPDVVRERVDKMGFPTPMAAWFREDLYEPMADLLESQSFSELGIFNARSARKMLDKHRRRELDASDELFKLAQFYKWSQQAERVLTHAP